MWKLIAGALNRFIARSYEEAAAEKKMAATAPTASTAAALATAAPQTAVADRPATWNRDLLEQQFQRAAQLLQGSNAPAAEQMIRAAVEQIASVQPQSALHAEALFKESTILVAAGDLVAAETACRAAIAVSAMDDAASRDRLNHLTYLGGILSSEEKFEEADQLLREGLAERRTLFGPEHPGYAIGLSALADLLLARKQPVEALSSIDEAVRILGRAKHERWPTDLALRAFIVKFAGGRDAVAFTAWTDLTRGMQKTLANQCLRLTKQATPPLAQAVLTELRERLQSTPEIDAPLLLSVYIALANAAQLCGDHIGRIAACRDMVKLCEGMSPRNQLALARQALAMALDDAGRADEVPATFDAAVQTAREVNDLTLMTNVLRNYALWAEKSGQDEQADELHREAVDCGASSGDWFTHGRSTVSYGIYLRRQGRDEEARGLLEEAVAHLPPTHPDYETAQTHLRAMAE